MQKAILIDGEKHAEQGARMLLRRIRANVYRRRPGRRTATFPSLRPRPVRFHRSRSQMKIHCTLVTRMFI
jgi:hypothetical protein